MTKKLHIWEIAVTIILLLIIAMVVLNPDVSIGSILWAVLQMVLVVVGIRLCQWASLGMDQTEVVVPKRYCENCGELIRDGVRIDFGATCPMCGTPTI